MNLPIQAFLANFHIGCDPSSGFGIVSYLGDNVDIKKGFWILKLISNTQ